MVLPLLVEMLLNFVILRGLRSDQKRLHAALISEESL